MGTADLCTAHDAAVSHAATPSVKNGHREGLARFAAGRVTPEAITNQEQASTFMAILSRQHAEGRDAGEMK